MVSSARSRTLEVSLDWRSLMQKRKSPDPSTEPWGTPESTLTASDETPSGTRQLGPRTTRTETSRPVSEVQSACMLRQLGPYEKTTRTINNYCCLTYFFNKIDGNHKDTYSPTSVKSIGKCKKNPYIINQNHIFFKKLL